ncbi:MAG: hypothetical protein ACYDDF_05660 [Thermoplasmatota archaeon]
MRRAFDMTVGFPNGPLSIWEILAASSPPFELHVKNVSKIVGGHLESRILERAKGYT